MEELFFVKLGHFLHFSFIQFIDHFSCSVQIELCGRLFYHVVALIEPFLYLSNKIIMVDPSKDYVCQSFIIVLSLLLKIILSSYELWPHLHGG